MKTRQRLNRFLVLNILFVYSTACLQGVTLNQCRELARDNYPLIKQYDLVKQSTDYSLANAAKAWLPQVLLSAQATRQSDVAAFPDEMTALYHQIGIDMKGLNKNQYKLAMEVNQSLWDGGQHRAQKEIAVAEGELSRQSLEVELYAIRERVNNLYFGILMLHEQLHQNTLLQELLQSNHQTVGAYVANGTATQSDLDMIQAELLAAGQQRARIESAANAYRNMLSVMIGKLIDDTEIFEKPAVQIVSATNNRPELHLFEAQQQQFEAQKQAVHSAVKPRIGLFAQGFYGNPGLNLFQDMMDDKWTWNYLAGIRLQWNFGSLYTRKGYLQKLVIAQKQTDVRREAFLFNQNLAMIRQQNAIAEMNRIMSDDSEIIRLRSSIRKASEAKLANGTITVRELLRDITTESLAMQAKAVHEIEWLKNIQDLAHTLNN
jgi:outer membrane protein TolC